MGQFNVIVVKAAIDNGHEKAIRALLILLPSGHFAGRKLVITPSFLRFKRSIKLVGANQFPVFVLAKSEWLFGCVRLIFKANSREKFSVNAINFLSNWARSDSIFIA